MSIDENTLDGRVAAMVRRIVETVQAEQVILFGSRAGGGATRDSDVDLLVVMPLKQPRRRVEGDIYAALADSELAKDIIVVTPEELERFRETSGTVIRPAVETGIVVYRRAA